MPEGIAKTFSLSTRPFCCPIWSIIFVFVWGDENPTDTLLLGPENPIHTQPILNLPDSLWYSVISPPISYFTHPALALPSHMAASARLHPSFPPPLLSPLPSPFLPMT